MSTNMFRSALTNASRVAVKNPGKKMNFLYNDLLYHGKTISQQMKDVLNYNENGSYPPRINLLVPPSFEYMASTFGIWSNNCISVPLCTTHPVTEMDYYVKDSESSLIIAHSSFEDTAKELSQQNNNLPYLIIDDLSPNNFKQDSNKQIEAENYGENVISTLNNDKPSIFIYTSGTTSKPKGVVHTHNTIWCNIEMLTNEWFWTKDDSILNVLPMHHIHGLVNITFCALANGAAVTFDSPNPKKIWENFRNLQDLNVFMAVPTVYAKLIEVFESMTDQEKAECRKACDRFRLMVSGSAALPNSVMNKWKDLSGHWLLERYGMTEILMVISQKYNQDIAYRKPGTVGFPMRNVQTKITEENELYIKSATLFKEYYNKPEKTKEEFTQDGWFKTGDCCIIDDEGYYKIEGRKSIDIIKYGGYKISALDIERVFLENDQLKEVVVIGIPDETYGERIGAIVVLKDGVDKDNVTMDSLRNWAKDKIAKYKLPEMLLIVDEIPKNAMGKVAKKGLIPLLEEKAASK